MSGEGLRIFNEAGAPQANSDIFPLGISEANNLTLVDDGGIHPQPMVAGSITVTGTNPVVAFLPPVGVYISEDRVSNSGSSFTFYFRAKSYNAINMAYWIFDVPTRALKDPTLSAAGIRAYDQNGVLSFDAATSNFRIVGFLDPSVPTNTTPGEGMLYESTSEITVPPGKTYALVQSEYLYSATMWDMGQYSELPGGQIDLPEGEPGLIPPNAQYKTMQLESYYLAGGRSDANTLVAGVKQFEHFQGWYPIGQTEHIEINGSTGHTVIDVSNFVGGGTVNPGVISVNVDNLERNATGPGGSTTLSNYVNLSISGGTAPYTITWQKIPGGATEVVNDSALNATSFRTKVVSQVNNTVLTAKWRALVVDANSISGSSPDVTFTHSAFTADDYVPDAITPFDVMNFSSNDPDVSWSSVVRKITGINKPITLRFERYDYSGNFNELYMDVFSSTSSATGPWTHHGYFPMNNTGLQVLDVPNVVNNTWIYYKVHAVTTSGKKTGNVRLTVWNLSNPGGSLVLSNVANNTFTVDADDNFNNGDYDLNAINWANISFTTTGSTGLGQNPALTIAGINRPVVIRAHMTPVTSNFESSSSWAIYVNGTRAYGSIITNGAWVEATVNAGDQVYFRLDGVTNSGRRTHSSTVTVMNQTTGATLDTFTISGTLDSDDNHNVADPNPNAISLANQNVVTDEWEGYTHGAYFQIVGINQPITIRISRGPTTDSQNIFTRRLIIGQSTNGGTSYVETNMGALSAPRDFTANNGDWFFLKGYFSTNAGRGSSSWTTTVTNATTGATLGSCLVSGTVDNDNNYNVSPLVVTVGNPYSSQNDYVQSGQWYGISDSPSVTVTGGTPPYYYNWVRTYHTGSPISISNSTIANPTFSTYAQTSWRVYAEYTLTVTDSAGGSQVVGFTADWAAGDQAV